MIVGIGVKFGFKENVIFKLVLAMRPNPEIKEIRALAPCKENTHFFKSFNELAHKGSNKEAVIKVIKLDM